MMGHHIYFWNNSLDSKSPFTSLPRQWYKKCEILEESKKDINNKKTEIDSIMEVEKDNNNRDSFIQKPRKVIIKVEF